MKLVIFLTTLFLSTQGLLAKNSVKCEKLTLYKRKNLNDKVTVPIVGHLYKDVAFNGSAGFQFSKKNKFNGLEAILTESQRVGSITLKNSKTGKTKLINKFWVMMEVSAAERIAKPGQGSAFGEHLINYEGICTETNNQ